MGDLNTVKLLKECADIFLKKCWLTWIVWHLDRYIRVSKKNTSRYGKIQRMANRYNYIFAEDLFCNTTND